MNSYENKEQLILSKEVFKTLFKNKELSIPEYLYLFSKFYGLGWTRYIPDQFETKLKNKNYLTKNAELAAKARDLMVEILSLNKSAREQLELEAAWEEFWETYPTTDAHAHFEATRKMKDSESTSRSIYYALREHYSAEEILTGLKNHIQNMKTRSIKENQLKYMKNSTRWLKDKEFLAWNNSTTPPPSTNQGPKNVF